MVIAILVAGQWMIVSGLSLMVGVKGTRAAGIVAVSAATMWFVLTTMQMVGG